MKHKFFIPLFFLLAMAMTFTVSAQKPANMTNSGATVTNTATVNLTYRNWGSPLKVAFHLRNVKTSGTVAGKTYLEHSNTGVTYIAIDSITNTNIATNEKWWEVTNPAAGYYRVRNVGSGTMVYVSNCTVREYNPYATK